MKDSIELKINQYFVDEAGDLTLFDKWGKIIVGNEGVSKTFMVGAAKISKIDKLTEELIYLQREIGNDSDFKGVPSIDETLKQSHACKDLPEIRRDVFRIIQKFEIQLYFAIRRKLELAIFCKKLFELKQQKFNQNDIYDDLVKRVFRNLLHKADLTKIYFSRRGKSTRTDALMNAIAGA